MHECCEGPPGQGGPLASDRPASDGAASDRAASDGATRVLLRLSYDGGAFSGFAENRGVTTVAGVLRAKLERVYGQPLTLSCAGRTDAGVHARAQHVTFTVHDEVVEPERLQRSLNSLLAPTVVVQEVRVVDARFDARYAARWRSYRYHVLDAPLPDAFLAATTWWVRWPLDPDAMSEAARSLLGVHDFSAFCRRPRSTPNATLVRRLLQAEWVREPAIDGRPALLRFDISATAFCHQMVRSIVGTLVDVGRGKLQVDDVARILDAADRTRMGNIAPPQGLCLWDVGYPGDPEPPWWPAGTAG
ncbi:MAG: tRNA pseudouridine(38-40) synthase TruA [Microthrixaceae bacterium]